MVEKIYCQSCAMPLDRDESFGTNVDDSKCQEYCIYCYKKGEFTETDITLKEMLDKVDNIMKQMGMAADIINKTKQMIPELKRWKK